MKSTILTNTLVAAVLLSVSAASAQTHAIRQSNNGTPVIQDHASTFEEGVLRGYADLWRAAGDYNYNRSLGAINWEEARRRYLLNRAKYVELSVRMAQLRQEAKEARARYHRKRRPSKEERIGRAKQRAPKRLASHEFNRVVGRLRWPSALEHEEFAAERRAVDRMLAKRATGNGDLRGNNDRRVKELTRQLRHKLNGQVKTLRPKEYNAAVKFLRSLRLELRSPLDMSGIAAS